LRHYHPPPEILIRLVVSGGIWHIPDIHSHPAFDISRFPQGEKRSAEQELPRCVIQNVWAFISSFPVFPIPCDSMHVVHSVLMGSTSMTTGWVCVTFWIASNVAFAAWRTSRVR
jgi:hypothetical protein